jgi:anti-anti-sigma regulatory factor
MSADLASPTATCHGAVTSSTESGRIVIVLCGEIDLVVDALVDSRELLSSSGVRVAVVDMAETTCFSSCGAAPTSWA